MTSDASTTVGRAAGAGQRGTEEQTLAGGHGGQPSGARRLVLVALAESREALGDILFWCGARLVQWLER